MGQRAQLADTPGRQVPYQGRDYCSVSDRTGLSWETTCYYQSSHTLYIHWLYVPFAPCRAGWLARSLARWPPVFHQHPIDSLVPVLVSRRADTKQQTLETIAGDQCFDPWWTEVVFSSGPGREGWESSAISCAASYRLVLKMSHQLAVIMQGKRRQTCFIQFHGTVGEERCRPAAVATYPR